MSRSSGARSLSPTPLDVVTMVALLLRKLALVASCAAALRVQSSRRVACQGFGAAVALPVVLAPPALADEAPATAQATAASLKPLYKAATQAKLTRRALPGEVAVPEAFEQGMDSGFVARYSDPNHPGGIRDITMLETQVGIFRLAKVNGGGGKGEPASAPPRPPVISRRDHSRAQALSSRRSSTATASRWTSRPRAGPAGSPARSSPTASSGPTGTSGQKSRRSRRQAVAALPPSPPSPRRRRFRLRRTRVPPSPGGKGALTRRRGRSAACGG